MSISDDALSFRDGHFKYRMADNYNGRMTYRNGIGWEIRHVSPDGKASGGSWFRPSRKWRYDVHDVTGRLVASEPTFWEASRAFSAAYVGSVR